MQHTQKKEEEKQVHTFEDLKKEERHHILRVYDYLTFSLRKEIKKRPWEFVILFFIALCGTTVFSGILITFITGGINVRYSMPSVGLPNFSLPNIAGAQLSTGNNRTFPYEPMFLLEQIRSGSQDYLLIDIRTLKEYEAGHIKTAVSMPVYGTELLNVDKSINGGLIRKAVNNKFPNKKEIIVYGHSQNSSIAHEVASSIGGNAKALGIGWNEWAHFKTFWVPETQWDEIDINEYIQIREDI